jgi:hypothetical protein
MPEMQERADPRDPWLDASSAVDIASLALAKRRKRHGEKP